MGGLVKSLVAAAWGVSPAALYHVTVMPCYDKKLEASRDELTTTSDEAAAVAAGSVAVAAAGAGGGSDMEVDGGEVAAAAQDGGVNGVSSSGRVAEVSAQLGFLPHQGGITCVSGTLEREDGVSPRTPT